MQTSRRTITGNSCCPTKAGSGSTGCAAKPVRLRECRFVLTHASAAAEVEGVPCYPNLKAIPGGVTAVVVFTPPQATEGVVRECVELGIKHVWLHCSFGAGSASAAA